MDVRLISFLTMFGIVPERFYRLPQEDQTWWKAASIAYAPF